MQGDRKDLTLTGDIREVRFPELLARLHRARATGILCCLRGESICSVTLAEGVPVWISSSNAEHSFAAFLFRTDRIPLGALASDREEIAAVLLEPDEAVMLGRRHALEMLFDLFNLAQGAFVFHPLDRPAATESNLGVEFADLISRAMRRVVCIDTLLRLVGPLERCLSVEMRPAASRHPLPADTQRALARIAGGAMASAGPLPDDWPSDLRLLQCLAELVLLGFIREASGPGVAWRTLLRGIAHRSEKSGVAGPTGPTGPMAVPPVADPPACEAEQPLAIPAGPIASPQAARMAASWYRKGQQALCERDLFTAVTSFREAVALVPDHPDYLFRLGVALARNRVWRKESEETLVQAARLNPEDARVHVALGRLYALSGIDRRAHECVQRALSIDPQDPAVRNGLESLQKMLERTAANDGAALRRARSQQEPEEEPVSVF